MLLGISPELIFFGAGGGVWGGGGGWLGGESLGGFVFFPSGFGFPCLLRWVGAGSLVGFLAVGVLFVLLSLIFALLFLAGRWLRGGGLRSFWLSSLFMSLQIN